MDGDEYGDSTLHDVAEQREQAAAHSTESGHIGGADIAAAGSAGVDSLESFGNDEAERDSTEKKRKDEAEGKDEIAHGRVRSSKALTGKREGAA